MIKAVYVSRSESGKLSGYVDKEDKTRIRFSEGDWKNFIKSDLGKSAKISIFQFVQKLKGIKK